MVTDYFNRLVLTDLLDFQYVYIYLAFAVLFYIFCLR